MSTTAIKERPILFSGEMVRAILEGRKQQTRRIVKPQPPSYVHEIRVGMYEPVVIRKGLEEPGLPVFGFANEDQGWKCKFGQPGDRLWVRETFTVCADSNIFYRADGKPDPWDGVEWKPSIHMPRKASRITLEITGVRVEKLNDISERDAKAEGWPGTSEMPWSPRGWFQSLWQSINGEASWKANPWVWVIEFKRTDADQTSASGGNDD